jgi:enoyl-CoA hydratase/carnithine racemase
MKRINAPNLIELAIDTLRGGMQGQRALGPKERYELAMVIRALQIARGEILSEPEAAQWALLDEIYDDGDGTPEKLARDIRSKTVTDATYDGLRKGLERILLAELETRNPAAIRSRS